MTGDPKVHLGRRTKGRPSTPYERNVLGVLGAAALKRFRENFTDEQRCTAIAKVSGQRCRNAAVKGKRVCRYHGGLTPKGAGWHKRAWTISAGEVGLARFHRKMQDVARDDAERAARIAALSPEARQRYDKWLREHLPGDPKARQRAKAERKANAEFRARAEAASPPPPSPAAAALDAQIAEIEAALAKRDWTVEELKEFGGVFE